MQLTSNSTTFSPQVQAILPILENLSINERLSVIGFLANPQKDNVALSKKDEPSIAQKRFNRFPNAIKMSDDFDDDLGDEFWLGKDV